MSSLAELPELVGFFSYARKDDEQTAGALSRLRASIQKELRLQLGREFRLWQDVAIPEGALWEAEIRRAVAESVFFIPIVTPTSIASPHCKFELQAFLEREAALSRDNLMFPILYIRVPALESELLWRRDGVLSIIGARQYMDWRTYRHRDLASPEVAEKVEHFCGNIFEALHQPWLSPQERARLEADAARDRAQPEERGKIAAEAERQRLESEAARKREAEEQVRAAAASEAERRRLEDEAAARRRAQVQAFANERRGKRAEEWQPRKWLPRWVLVGIGALLFVAGSIGVWLVVWPPNPVRPPATLAVATPTPVPTTGPEILHAPGGGTVSAVASPTPVPITGAGILHAPGVGTVGAVASPTAVPTTGAETLHAPGGGTVRALVVGVDKYPQLGPGAQLHGAATDAQDIAAALAKDDVKADLILNGDATRARVVEAMNDLVKDAQPGDLAFISYAGNGMQTPEYPRWAELSRSGASEQIVLSNFSYSGPGAGEIIVNIEMRAWLSRLDAKGVDTVLMMDASFGGGMRGIRALGELRVREVKGIPDASEREKFTGIPMTDKEARSDVAAMPHVTFLSGAASNSVVPEMPGLDPRDLNGPRGALSYYIARVLEGGASVNGVVTRKSLFQFVLQNVRQATNGRQAVDTVPRSADAEIPDKPIFVFGAARAAPTPTIADCPGLVAVFDRAVAAKSVEGEMNAMDAIAADIGCNHRTDEFRRKLIDSMIALASDPQVPADGQEKALEDAKEAIIISGSWRDAEHLADFFWRRKDDLNAFKWYESALAFISARPAEHATANEIKQLETRASAAKKSRQRRGRRQETGAVCPIALKTAEEFAPVTRNRPCIDSMLYTLHSVSQKRWGQAKSRRGPGMRKRGLEMRKLVSISHRVAAAAMFLLLGLTPAGAEILRAPGGGTVHALVLGAGEYSRLGLSAQLRSATADALDITHALAKDDVKVDLLLNGDLTRARVIDAMNDLVNAAQPGDLVFITYSGHGMQTPEYPRWKGLSPNGASEQIALSNFSFSGSGLGEVIVNVELRAWLSRLDAKGADTIVVMDADFGGGMLGTVPHAREVRGDAPEREKFTGIPMTDKEAHAEVATMPHITFLAGATSNSVIRDVPGLESHGPEGGFELLRRSRPGRRRVGRRRGHTKEPIPVRAPECETRDKRATNHRYSTGKRRCRSPR